MDNNLDSIFYHYTTLDALYNGIIVNNPDQYNELCLWATHSDYLNDKSEIKFSSVLIDEKIQSFCSGKYYQDYLFIKALAADKIHLLSFSKNRDSLPMWSMYGKQGKGIMLGLDFNSIDDIFKCEYLSEKELSSYIDTFLNKLLEAEGKENERFEQSKILIELCRKTIILKSKYFEYEEEFRMSINPDMVLEQIVNDLNPNSQVDFCLNENLLIPHFKYYFPKKMLVELWIGPTQNRELSAKSLQQYLDKYGFNHTKIINSDCPLR